MSSERNPTLAEKLGTTTQLSPLMMKARRLGLDARGLERLAVERGCVHYSQGEGALPDPVPVERFSNEELAVALLNPALPYDPHSIRCGAAMLGATGNRPKHLARLLKMERAEQPARQVAEAGRRFEPDNPFWTSLLEALSPTATLKSGVMPHPTRYVAMTGLTRSGPGIVTRWIRPGTGR